MENQGRDKVRHSSADRHWRLSGISLCVGIKGRDGTTSRPVPIPVCVAKHQNFVTMGRAKKYTNLEKRFAGHTGGLEINRARSKWKRLGGVYIEARNEFLYVVE